MANNKISIMKRILALSLAGILTFGVFSGCKKEEEPEETTTEITTEETTVPVPADINPLTGESGYDVSLAKNRPVIISVENHPQARPQWGITTSDIEFEMVAEGGITRMLHMFADKSRVPEKIGPVRSMRHYFVELANGYDAIFVHWGGSPQAYKRLKADGVNDIDAKYVTSCFFRDRSRGVAIEHTGYTTCESLTKAIEAKEYRTTLKDDAKVPFRFSENVRTLGGGECTKCVVSFSSGYTYTYTYDEENKVYLSSLNGKNFTDSEGTQQSFTNVIVLYTTISSLNDAKGRVTFDLKEGKGKYFSNGTYEDITWKKGESADMLQLYDAEGNDLLLNVGRSYIAFVDKSRESVNTIS